MKMPCLPKHVEAAIWSGPKVKVRNWRKLKVKSLTRAERAMKFSETYLLVPEGELVGKPIRLDIFQEAFFYAVYDNPHHTREAYLSMARKNAKTGTIAIILLVHLAGPEAVMNSRIISGALSREQASEVFNYAAKMIRQSETLSRLCRIVDSGSKIIGVSKNVEYKALSADAKNNHGKGPVLAILDETGQVRGPKSDFVDSITTSQSLYEHPLLIAISVQAANDGDMFSIWLDDAKKNQPKSTVAHVYTTDEKADLTDEKSWIYSNPALGKFKSLSVFKDQADKAKRMPSFEATFRNLELNQRVQSIAPFVSKEVWLLNGHEPDPQAFYEAEVYAGLDLSGKTDLTSFVMAAFWRGRWHVRAYFWTPEKGLEDRSKRDRAPYDVWVKQGHIKTTAGAAIDYEHVVQDIVDAIDGCNIVAISYDRWRIDLFKRELEKLGIELPLVPFGQGFKDMGPALTTLEIALLNEQIAHGMNPALTMCAANAVTEKDAADNRKLTKSKSTGRIDGMVALAMALGAAGKEEKEDDEEFVYVGM
jgi:phage terminase large subunit-like protein